MPHEARFWEVDFQGRNLFTLVTFTQSILWVGSLLSDFACKRGWVTQRLKHHLTPIILIPLPRSSSVVFCCQFCCLSGPLQCQGQKYEYNNGEGFVQSLSTYVLQSRRRHSGLGKQFDYVTTSLCTVSTVYSLTVSEPGKNKCSTLLMQSIKDVLKTPPRYWVTINCGLNSPQKFLSYFQLAKPDQALCVLCPTRLVRFFSRTQQSRSQYFLNTPRRIFQPNQKINKKAEKRPFLSRFLVLRSDRSLSLDLCLQTL